MEVYSINYGDYNQFHTFPSTLINIQKIKLTFISYQYVSQIVIFFIYFILLKTNQLAVEYYDSNNDDMFIYYKNKIVHLHSQANVIKAMNKHVAPHSNYLNVKSPNRLDKQKSENYTTSTSAPSMQCMSDEILQEISKKEKEQKQKQKTEKMKVFEEKSVVGITDAVVNKILDIQDEQVIEQEIIIEKDLKKQTNNILKRLSKRIKTKEKCQTPPSSSSKKQSFKLDLTKTESQNFGAGVEQYISNAKAQSSITTRQQRQKPSLSVIDNIVANFVNDKKRSLTEEKNFKIDQIEFEFEKLTFKLEKSKTVLTEEERKKLESEKDNKIKAIEDEYILKEQQEIELIHQKYYKNQVTPQNKVTNLVFPPNITFTTSEILVTDNKNTYAQTQNTVAFM